MIESTKIENVLAIDIEILPERKNENERKFIGAAFHRVGENYLDSNIRQFFGESAVEELDEWIKELPKDTVIIGQNAIFYDFLITSLWPEALLVNDAYYNEEMQYLEGSGEGYCRVKVLDIHPKNKQFFESIKGCRVVQVDGNSYYYYLPRKYARYRYDDAHYCFDTLELSDSNMAKGLKWLGPICGHPYRSFNPIKVKNAPIEKVIEYNTDDLLATLKVFVSRNPIKPIIYPISGATGIMQACDLLGADKDSQILGSFSADKKVGSLLIKRHLKWNRDFSLLKILDKIPKDNPVREPAIASYKRWKQPSINTVAPHELIFDLSGYTKSEASIDFSNDGGFHYPTSKDSFSAYFYRESKSDKFCYYLDFSAFYPEVYRQSGMFGKAEKVIELINLKNTSHGAKKQAAKIALNSAYGQIAFIKNFPQYEEKPGTFNVTAIAQVTILLLLQHLKDEIEGFERLLHLNTDGLGIETSKPISSEEILKLKDFKVPHLGLDMPVGVDALKLFSIKDSNSYAYICETGEVKQAGNMFSGHSNHEMQFCFYNLREVIAHEVLETGEYVKPVVVAPVKLPLNENYRKQAKLFKEWVKDMFGELVDAKNVTFAAYLHPKIVDEAIIEHEGQEYVIDESIFDGNLALFHGKCDVDFVKAVELGLVHISDSMTEKGPEWSDEQLKKLSMFIKMAFAAKLSDTNPDIYPAIMKLKSWEELPKSDKIDDYGKFYEAVDQLESHGLHLIPKFDKDHIKGSNDAIFHPTNAKIDNLIRFNRLGQHYYNSLAVTPVPEKSGSIVYVLDVDVYKTFEKSIAEEIRAKIEPETFCVYDNGYLSKIFLKSSEYIAINKTEHTKFQKKTGCEIFLAGRECVVWLDNLFTERVCKYLKQIEGREVKSNLTWKNSDKILDFDIWNLDYCKQPNNASRSEVKPAMIPKSWFTENKEVFKFKDIKTTTSSLSGEYKPNGSRIDFVAKALSFLELIGNLTNIKFTGDNFFSFDCHYPRDDGQKEHNSRQQGYLAVTKNYLLLKCRSTNCTLNHTPQKITYSHANLKWDNTGGEVRERLDVLYKKWIGQLKGLKKGGKK